MDRTNDEYLYIPDIVLEQIEQDTFGHSHIADAVVQSIKNTSPPFTIGIFGGWGTGKSSILSMVDMKLKSSGIPTVSIDAWRYSSAESLKRAFLIHVAHDLSPNQLTSLRTSLYSTEQETLPPEVKRFDLEEPRDTIENLANLAKMIGMFFLRFMLFSVLFIGILIFLYWLLSIISDQPEHDFSFATVIITFIDLAFIPFIVTLIDQLRPYISQEPIVVTHERIDADEMLTAFFNKVVRKAISCKKSQNKRLVVFIDNLDRLNDEKMVDALEALKTYINNENCIFVIACDDSIVRSVIENSDKVPQSGSNNRQVGEDYLDKFFQQTFRIPAYMGIDLFDFAEKQFSKTQLFNSLKQKEEINIHNLLSTALPSDVNSPRKVKRLLNEFIATFEIAKRRETETHGQLRPGALTKDPEFLGKLSTIRAEYPDFYQKILENPKSLEDLTNLIQEQQIDKVKNILSVNNSHPKLESFIGYLRKTQTVMVRDIEPYIWLSQDNLALGLKSGKARNLRIFLSNGDDQAVLSMLETAHDLDEKILLGRIATRYVDKRLKGLEQQNGTIVLARIIETIEPVIRNEVAQVTANLIPQWPLDTFTAEEVFGVLKWARRAESSRLINSVLDRLEKLEFRQDTFSAILKYWDVIEKSEATINVQEWLEQILSEQAQIDKDNQEFAHWMVELTLVYKDNNDVLERYFSQSLTDYMVDRLIQSNSNLSAVNLSTEEGEEYIQALSVIANYSESSRSSRLWVSLPKLLSTNLQELYFLGSDLLNDRTEYIPEEHLSEFVKAITTGISNIASQIKDPPENWVTNELKKVIYLINKSEVEIEEEARNSLKICLISLGQIDSLSGDVIDFTDSYIEKADAVYILTFLEATIEIFEKLCKEVEKAKPYFDLLIKNDNYINDDLREDLFIIIDRLATSNEPNDINAASEYLRSVINIQSMRNYLEIYSSSWLESIRVEQVPAFKARRDLIITIRDLGEATSDAIAEKYIGPLPFGGNQQQLVTVLETFEMIKNEISNPIGLKIFHTFLSIYSHLGPLLPRYIGLTAQWIDLAEPDEQEQFITLYMNNFKNEPVEFTYKLPFIWKIMKLDQIITQLIQMYKVDLGTDYEIVRDKNTRLAFDSISSEDKVRITRNVWNQLISTNGGAVRFLQVSMNKLSLQELNSLREEAIRNVRSSGATTTGESNLSLLSSSNRPDVREVMQVISLFSTLYGQGEDEIKLANKYVINCLKPMDLKSKHKHRLAEAMAEASSRFTGDLKSEIQVQAKGLGLYGIGFGSWAYRKHWEKY